jgi:hypothetical protein
MPWKTNLVQNPGYIEVTYTGKVTPEELYLALENAVLLSRESNIILFLADLTEMIGGHSVFDLYGVISIYETLNMDAKAKEAIVMTSLQDTVDEIKFYETTCKNRGFNVRVFKLKEEAISWLVTR